MPSRMRRFRPARRVGAGWFEQTTRASHSKYGDRGSPGVTVTLPRVSLPAHGLHFVSPEENTMYYGVGGTILIVLLVLFFLGRL